MDIEAYIQSVITGTDYKIALGRLRNHKQKYRVKEDDHYTGTSNLSYISDGDLSGSINGRHINNNKFSDHMYSEPEFAPPPRTPGYATAQTSKGDNSWSKKKLQTRNVVLIVLGCVLAIGLAVGTGVGIVLSQQESLETSSTTSPPFTNTTKSDYISYKGTLRLTQPWNGSLQTLKTHFTYEMDEILKNSTLGEYFISSSITNYSHENNSIEFSLDFKSSLYDVNITNDSPGVDVFARQIEFIIVEGETTLLFNESSVIIIDQIMLTTPLPTSSSPSPSTSSSPSPSSSPASSPSTSPSSTSPSSTPQSTTPQSTTTQQQSPTTTTQQLISTTTQQRSTTTEAVTTTTVQLPSTTSEIVTTEAPVKCVYQDYELCKQFGNTFTLLPNFFFSETIESAINDFQAYFNATIESGCSKDALFFFCNFVFPQCDEDANKKPVAIYPCDSVCEDVTGTCSDVMPFPLSCTYPGSNSSQCVSPPPEITTPAPKTCHEVDFAQCNALDFNDTSLPTLFATDIAGTILEFNTYALYTVESKCSANVEFFYCGLFFPRCVDGNHTLPCRSLCEEITRDCSEKLVFPIDCLIFPNDTDNCLLPTTLPVTATTIAPPTTRTPPPMERCVPNAAELCRNFGVFNQTRFPNQWYLNSEYEALEAYKNFGEEHVSRGCNNGTLFYLCAVLFPPCEEENFFRKPCMDFCQDIARDCKEIFFGQTCELFADNSPSCLRPPQPKDCGQEEFSCHGSHQCIPNSNVCDGYDDCTDWSDERNCVCNEYQYQCKMGMCIKNYQRCNDVADCPDRSDEKNCTCPQGQFTCGNGQCIMPEWVCDRQYDCPNNEDEVNCTGCTQGEFRCLSGECILAHNRCDGTPQCPDHSDEKKCIIEVEPEQPFLLGFDGDDGGWFPVCAENFTMELADLTCQKFGHLLALNWSAIEYQYYNFVTLDIEGDRQSVIGKAFIRPTCPSDKVVALKCEPKGCGQRHTGLVDFIVNGNDAAPGYWPWQVSIQRIGKHYCGGSLISPNFVVTAAHCIEQYKYDFSFIDIVLGANKLSAKEPTQIKRKIKRLVIHNHIFHERNDIALIHLAMPVTYTNYIQPICLPEANEVFSRSDLCYAVGWGMKAWNTTFSNHLQEAKMTLWDTDKCNSSWAWNGAVGDTFICAGYYSGFISTCSGDSGGSLVCQGNDYIWKLIGISSYVARGCNIPERPVVFSDAKFFTPWIQNNTKCVFVCDNGNCLFDRQQLCNRENDCGDNSDETKPCVVSVNCTFDDQFLCGYEATKDWDRLSVTSLNNHYALYDHTQGEYPGYFMVGRSRGLLLTTPKFNATSNMCLRFYYHMRGDIIGGIQVWLHQYNSDGSDGWEPVFKRKDEVLPDKWMTGNIDLKDEELQVVFVTNVDGRVVVDDVQLLDTPCESAECGSEEFTCGTGVDKQCIPKGSRCNKVIDCEFGEDEDGCSDSTYLCDFDKQELCGFQQDTTDNKHAEWRVVNASKTHKRFTDHSTGTELGNMLVIETRNLLLNKEVKMTQHLKLDGKVHCLSFYYYSNTAGSLQTSYSSASSGTNVVIWGIYNRMTTVWSKTQVSLPAVQNLTLTYTMYGGKFIDLRRPFIALDDVQISEGDCPQFECPRDYLPCVNENYCLPMNKFCNRIEECSDSSDEASCTCTPDEFKCPGGPCIDKSLTCNRVDDCLDGSDEANCEQYNTVTCDFEHDYLCGYKFQTGDYSWKRNYGNTNSGGTGPSNDHTYQNQTGQYLYADGSDGTALAKTLAETPSFNATGKHVEFYYHMFSMFSVIHRQYAALMLIVKDRDMGKNSTVFSADVTYDRSWRYACLNLPVSPSISLMFVAQRGDLTPADIAIDDIKLLNGTCKVETTSATSAASSATTTTGMPVTATTAATCPVGQRACRNGYCIAKSQWCDNFKDCVDNSDEMACP